MSEELASSPSQAAVDGLIGILDLEEIEVNVFRGQSPKEDRQRVFGGQVAGQALVAAGRTVDGLVVHSLHAYFLRPGETSMPILYPVDRIRDGKSFATRRVVAIQRGKAIFHLSGSFQKPEIGLEHQIPMPEAPDPESLPAGEQRLQSLAKRMPPERMTKEMRSWLERPRPIDMRLVNPPKNPFEPEKRPPRQMVWMRANGKLPDAPLLHHCVAAYASDMSLLDTATLPHGIAWAFMNPDYQMASLDHAMWFHRPFRADEWLLYAEESPSTSGARGFAMGHMFTRDGRLVVSVAQEGLLRPIGERIRARLAEASGSVGRGTA
jgi:acyl-CoA thioesterase-2